MDVALRGARADRIRQPAQTANRGRECWPRASSSRTSSCRWRSNTHTTARYLLASIAVFVLGIGESIGVLANAAWGRARIAARALAVLLCVPPVYRVLAFPPPYQWTVTGSYLSQIRQRWQPGDVVYATYGRALEVLNSAPTVRAAA